MKKWLWILSLLTISAAYADPRAAQDAGAPRGAPLFQILNDPYAKRPDTWITYQLDLVTNETGDLVSGHYHGGRENGFFTMDEVKAPGGAVLMKTKEGIEALKLLGPDLSAKDGGLVTFTYITSPFEEPGKLEMKLARAKSGWTAAEAATGKVIRQLKLKTRFCGSLGPCGIESVTVND